MYVRKPTRYSRDKYYFHSFSTYSEKIIFASLNNNVGEKIYAYSVTLHY